MRIENLNRTLMVAAACSFLSGAAHADEITADTIYRNGEFYTPDGWETSIAIKDGVIVAIGDDSDVAPYKSGKTDSIDLKGATVFPGIHDMHVHPMGAGLAQLQCRWNQGADIDNVLETVKGCVARRKKGEWITGGQWDVKSLGVAPHRKLLDKVAPDNPVVLTDISGHSSWANSKALELSGITDKTPDPKGGIFEREADGKLTGVMRESATFVVRRHVPPTTDELNQKALKWSLDTMLSYGITSFTDALMDRSAMRAYAALSDKGDLKQLVKGCIFDKAVATAEHPLSAIEERNLYARENFWPTCVKIALDGVPTDGHTAAMVEPYADAEDPTDIRARGLLMYSEKELHEKLVKYDRMGLSVKMHAVGDAAVRAGIKAVAAARETNGFSGIMHDASHNSFIQPEDTKKAAEAGVTFEMSPYIWYPNPIIPDIAKAIGPERMKRWTPVKDAIEGGGLVVLGSDWSFVPSVNPWIALETLVTRQAPGGVGEPLGAPITLKQAIDLFTKNAALQMDRRSTAGVLAVGMLADMVVIDRNPFKIKITDVHNTKVLKTIINGEVVYSATQ